MTAPTGWRDPDRMATTPSRTAALSPAGLAAALLAAACAHAPPANAGRPPPALPGPWESPRYRDHPLAGRILDVRSGRFLDPTALESAAAAAPFLLLGETHDNADHHRLQAWLLRAAAAGRRPALAFEMLDASQQPAVDAVRAEGGDADAIARAVAWERSGWPPFAMYRPLFAEGLERGLAIVAANLPRTLVRAVVKEGRAALPEPLLRSLARDEPLAPAVEEGLRQEMAEVHCGRLPPELLDPLVLAQRARDAEMARRLLAADRGSGAVLIAGAGHVRRDRGVPALLGRDAPGRASLAVAFVEVSPSRRAPGDYAGDYSAPSLPFDVVVFTPAAERADPCAGIPPGTTTRGAGTPGVRLGPRGGKLEEELARPSPPPNQ